MYNHVIAVMFRAGYNKRVDVVHTKHRRHVARSGESALFTGSYHGFTIRIAANVPAFASYDLIDCHGVPFGRRPSSVEGRRLS